MKYMGSSNDPDLTQVQTQEGKIQVLISEIFASIYFIAIVLLCTLEVDAILCQV
jgi:hypothetical protein